MLTLKIGKKNWKVEFGFEAAYNEECVEKTINLIEMTDISNAESVKNIAKLPKLVVELFKSGLQEHNPVEAEEDVKVIVKQYFAENKKESFLSLAGKLIDCMGDDGFLQLIGILETPETEEAPEVPNSIVDMQTAKHSEN